MHTKYQRSRGGILLVMGMALVSFATTANGAAPRLVGYWKLRGDCQDDSGLGHHGVNHGVQLESGTFDGRGACVEVPDHEDLHLGSGAFTISAWVRTEAEIDDVRGDVLSKFDATMRRGLNLSLAASAPGYNSVGDARYIQFGIDDGQPGTWTDCGRPGGIAHNSDALTVFDGQLYAGTTDGPREEDWAHVYRYLGEQSWEDCGRVGTGRTRGVYALVVHDQHLYAATSASHGTQPDTMGFGRVYRYNGGQSWEDVGQPGKNYRVNCLASYRGRLYACAFNIGPNPGHCYVHEGGREWSECGTFDGWPHTMAVHDGRLFTAYPKGEVFAYDEREWQSLGNPFQSREECSQIHSLGVFHGELYAGSWPKGKVAVLRKGQWVDLGRLGDATEVIALCPYNGTLYAGTIPRAEVFRLDARQDWVSVRRLFDPPDFMPVPVGSGDARVADWSRATSLTVFSGKLFASTGTCYRTSIEVPLENEVRGKVHALQSGACVTYDQDLGSGWRHVVVTRDEGQLRIEVDGKLVRAAAASRPIDVTNGEPLWIGFGQQDYFSGRMREVRLYQGALDAAGVAALFAEIDPKSLD